MRVLLCAGWGRGMRTGSMQRWSACPGPPSPAPGQLLCSLPWVCRDEFVPYQSHKHTGATHTFTLMKQVHHMLMLQHNRAAHISKSFPALISLFCSWSYVMAVAACIRSTRASLSVLHRALHHEDQAMPTQGDLIGCTMQCIEGLHQKNLQTGILKEC